MKLVYASKNRFPMPAFFTFVFTDANGDHLYVACLRFYEAVDVNELSTTCEEICGEKLVRFFCSLFDFRSSIILHIISLIVCVVLR